MLWSLCAQGDAPLVERILSKKGSDANVTQKFSVTPLHRAAGLGNLAICETLLKKGASATATDDEKATPAAYAKEKGFNLLTTMLQKWEEEEAANAK